LDKERKEQEKESIRRKRESDREMKEKLKKEEIELKQNKKLISQSTKESKQEVKKDKNENKEKNKIRSQYRKDFSNDLKRIRGDANASVLSYFDEEENLAEQAEQLRLSTSKSVILSDGVSAIGERDSSADVAALSSDDLSTFLQSIPSCNDFFLNLSPSANINIKNEDKYINDNNSSPDGTPLEWDDVFQVANCLYAFNSFLKLQMPIKLDSLIEKIAYIAAIGCGQDGHNVDVGDGDSKLIQDKSLTVECGSDKGEEMVVEKERLDVNNEDDEAEWDESDQPSEFKSNNVIVKKLKKDNTIENEDNPKLLEAQADIDRIHLCLVNALTSDLHSLLDLDESEKTGPAVKFPLNQVLYICMYVCVCIYIYIYIYVCI
jgi:hypothetical protein